jgi:hypothetical protein
MQPTKKVSPVIAALIVIVLIGIVITTVVVANQSEETPAAETSQQEETQGQTNNISSASEDVSYADGTYTEKGRYISPGGAESIEVTVTLEGDIITSASVKSNAISSDSKQYQAEFISGYKKLVVGKDIDEVSLSRVAGSSLTSNGFNEALELIKADAKA